MRLDPPPGQETNGLCRIPHGQLVEICFAEKVMPDSKSPIMGLDVAAGQRGAPMHGTTGTVQPHLAHAPLFAFDVVVPIRAGAAEPGLRLPDHPSPVAFMHGPHRSDDHPKAFVVSSDGYGYRHNAWDIRSNNEVRLGAMRMAGHRHRRGRSLGRYVLISQLLPQRWRSLGQLRRMQLRHRRHAGRPGVGGELSGSKEQPAPLASGRAAGFPSRRRSRSLMDDALNDVIQLRHGPVSEALATALGRQKKVAVFERWHRRCALPRAVCIDHQTCRMLSAIGMAEGLPHVSHPAPPDRSLTSRRRRSGANPNADHDRIGMPITLLSAGRRDGRRYASGSSCGSRARPFPACKPKKVLEAE